MSVHNRTVVHSWALTTVHLLRHLVFLVWSALLTYRNGPYYTLLELCRNLQIFGYRKLDYHTEFGTDLHGKVCLITGGTRGIGLEVVKFLLTKGCTIVTGTSKLDAQSTTDQIAKCKNNVLTQVFGDSSLDQSTKHRMAAQLVVLPLDLSSMTSVANFADKIFRITDTIDYLICNGGVMFVPFTLTEDHFEHHMAINYLSHCLLIVKLLPLLVKHEVAKSRIVFVSSGAHHASVGLRLHDLHSTNLFSVYHSYAQSKLAIVMFTYRLNRWLQQRPDLRSRVTVNCLHPGVCRTGLMENFNFFKWRFIQDTPLFRSPAEGAETILHVALAAGEASTSGQYFENCCPTRSSGLSYDESLQNELWSQTWTELRPWLQSEQITLLFAQSASAIGMSEK